MANKLIGQNYTTPDLVAKVTGQAKYAEDFRVDGMLFCKLLLSPLPHGRIKRIDTARALAMPGVKGILTADELPAPADVVTDLGQRIAANTKGEKALTNEPVYQGEPVLALAAVDERTAADAIERIEIDWEPLPFAVDPVKSLLPGGANARLDGNIWGKPKPAAPGQPVTPPAIEELKWTDAEAAEYAQGRLPMGKTPDEWSYGDVDAGFKNAALVLDETFVTPNTSHQTLEPRTAMAYWQNGKLYLHCSTQSVVQTVGSVSRWLHMDQKDIVLISQYTGGGFGSKATGTITAVIPALLSKKLNAPVMMRIDRETEHFIGGARPAAHGRLRAGFSADGRLTALDMFVVNENGPYEPVGDTGMTGRMVSLLFQPQAMRWRGVSVLTNTPPRRAQSQPGGMQGITLMEPILAKASRKLGVDQVAIHRINAPEGKATFGPANPRGQRAYATSAFVKNALDRGAQIFRWDERKVQGGKRQGSKVRGYGVATSAFVAGSTGYDGLFVIKPDGRMYIQSGIGNLGTESMSDCHRVSAELVGMPWEKVDVTWGHTGKNLPWSCVSGGSQTTHAHTRAAHAAGMDAVKKLQEIAAKTHGGRPEQYTVANERVSGPGGSLTLADAARKAIELGGKYDGHELPDNVNAFTKASATALSGQGLMGVARDVYPHDGATHSFVAAFAEVEVDVETGHYHIVDYIAVADVGTVIHPRALGGQILGRSMLGIGHAIGQHWVYDQHYGLPLAKRFHHNKPPTILDAPQKMTWEALNIADPETPVGARGIGEPPVAAGCCAVLNALSDALGDSVFRRAPVMVGPLLAALEAGHPVQEPLTAHI
ncbi:MAG TPA: xanthine dehydrogenase family protein molybdopterin-binding subunit [Vicinamibacterales bacterium]|jgi:CO/xanthine dehydrogenase Mo-binding subunit|nr:xanthine dehydrogenase family protein molybdopterin-binding subunit [Vicinamibacterales bacterium]